MASISTMMVCRRMDNPYFPQAGSAPGRDGAGPSRAQQVGDDDNEEDIEDKEGKYESNDKQVGGLMCWSVF